MATPDLTAGDVNDEPAGRRSVIDRITVVSPKVLYAVALVYALFHAYTALRGPLANIMQRDLHLSFALVLGYLSLASVPKRSWILRSLAVVAAVVAAVACVYTLSSYARIVDSHFLTVLGGDIFAGSAFVVLVLLLATRLVGYTVPVLAVLALLYTLYGHHIPGYWGHAEISFDFVVQTIYLSDVGMWGPITGASASLVAVFIIFAAVLNRTGAGETLFTLARAVTWRLRGGEAKLAVVGSAAFGTIHGTAVGNTAAIGPMTVPLMIRAGYHPRFSAAVETVASTGGQIMPPIMASAAFLMADLIGVPYTSIIKAAIIPALLYFASVWFVINLESRRLGMMRPKTRPVAEPLPPTDDPLYDERRREALRITGWTLAQAFIPIGLLLFTLYQGRSIPLSGAYALVASILIYIIRARSGSDLWVRVKEMLGALKEGGEQLVMLAVLVVAAQLIIAFFDASGLIQKMSGVLVDLASINVTLALIMAAFIVMVLGLGLPTTAAYLLSVPAVGTGLIVAFDIDPLGVHLFLLYYAVLSNVTPPVAPPAYVAAGIARTPWGPVAWLAMLIAAPLYVLPQFFVLRPSLLLDGPVAIIVLDVVCASMAVFLFAAGAVGYLRQPLGRGMRTVVFCVGALMLAPNELVGRIAAVVGAVLILVLVLMPRRASATTTSVAAPSVDDQEVGEARVGESR